MWQKWFSDRANWQNVAKVVLKQDHLTNMAQAVLKQGHLANLAKVALKQDHLSNLAKVVLNVMVWSGQRTGHRQWSQ